MDSSKTSDAVKVKMPSGELYRALRAVSMAASSDAKNVALHSVLFESSDEVALGATDGHWVARWRCEPTEASSRPAKMLVALYDVERLIPLLKADAVLLGECEIDFDAASVAFGDGTILAMTKLKEEWPDVDKVWPRSPLSPIPYVGFMSELLVKASRCFRVAMGEDVAVRFQFREIQGPISIYSEACEELAVLLMPATVEAPAESAPEKVRRQLGLFDPAAKSAEALQ